MGKYLFEANYTREGADGLAKVGGVSRRAALTDAIEGMGGAMEAFYYAFGDRDAYMIVDLPDDASATAVALTIARAGVLTIKTTVLITPETVDEAVAKEVPYRLPGD